MKVPILILLAACLASPITAFMPSPPISYTTRMRLEVTNANNKEEQLTTLTTTSKPSLAFLMDENGNAFQQAVHRFLAAGGGTIGDRGEVYFFAQALLVVGVALGGLPLVSDALRVVAGPGLFGLGIIVIILTAFDMGDSLTPWPKPNGEGLVTTGLYSQVRHPMYAGLLATLTGFSVWTASMDRLLLAALLWAILQVKSSFEEDALTKAYPEYVEYQTQVQSKFVPQILIDLGKEKKKDI